MLREMNRYYETGYYNIDDAAYAQTSAADAARKVSASSRTSRTGTRHARRANTLTVFIIAGALLLVFCNIFLVSEANRINNRVNTLQEENSCLEAEIDSLRNEITDSTTLDKLEKTASKKYGMVYPNSSNYVKIKDESKASSNLASTIKDEVYG